MEFGWYCPPQVRRVCTDWNMCNRKKGLRTDTHISPDGSISVRWWCEDAPCVKLVAGIEVAGDITHRLTEIAPYMRRQVGFRGRKYLSAMISGAKAVARGEYWQVRGLPSPEARGAELDLSVLSHMPARVVRAAVCNVELVRDYSPLVQVVIYGAVILAAENMAVPTATPRRLVGHNRLWPQRVSCVWTIGRVGTRAHELRLPVSAWNWLANRFSLPFTSGDDDSTPEPGWSWCELPRPAQLGVLSFLSFRVLHGLCPYTEVTPGLMANAALEGIRRTKK